MFILKCKKTKRYVREYNNHVRGGSWSFTTNINEARTYVNLDAVPSHVEYTVCSEYDPKLRVYVRYYPHDFDIVEIEIKEKRVFTNTKKGQMRG